MDQARVLDELRRLEANFLRPAAASTRAEFERLIDVDFREIGASGRVHSRDAVLDVLQARQQETSAAPWTPSDLECRQLADDLYLLTYSLAQGARLSRRSSIWRHAEQGWRIVFHQGTLVTSP